MDSVLITILVHFNTLVNFYQYDNLGTYAAPFPTRSFCTFSIPSTNRFNNIPDIFKITHKKKFKISVKPDSDSVSIDSARMVLSLITTRNYIAQSTWDSIFNISVHPGTFSTTQHTLTLNNLVQNSKDSAHFVFQTDSTISAFYNIRYRIVLYFTFKNKGYWATIDPLIANTSDQGSTPPQEIIRRERLVKP